MTPTPIHKMTLTEQRMVRMWSATSFGGDWFELNKTLWEIAMVMEAEGMLEAAVDFGVISRLALQRAIDEVADRKMKVAA